MPIEKHITLKNDLSELSPLAIAVEAFGEEAELSMKAQFNLNLALDELVTNIIHYAYDDENLHQIEITLRYDDFLLSVSVLDDGKAFNPCQADSPELTTALEQREIGGLGIHLVRTLMGKVNYHRVNEQNHLYLEKDLSEISGTGKD